MADSAETLNEVTRLSAANLASLLASGELSACEVVETHIRRIEAVNAKLNAVVVPLFDQARADARAADDSFRRGRLLGPLHGVPITIKELFDVEGAPTTAGLPKRSTHIAKRDAPLVARLRRAGAIVLGKTNVPQIGIGFDADNPVYGRTSNPWNVDRGPGGSSGGEAAIVAAGGSALGLGSDGGGSIRQPSHSCGICGLKPTGRRWTMEGHWSIPNWSVEVAQAGPLARTVADLELALRVLNGPWDEQRNDLTAPPILLLDSKDVRVNSLRVGFYTDDGCTQAAPAIRRAVREATAALADGGAEIIEFTPPDVLDAWRVFFGLFYADGLHFLKQQLSGSARRPTISQLVWFSRLPAMLRPLLAQYMTWIGQPWTARPLRWVRRRVVSTKRYLELLKEQDQYRRRFAEALDKLRLDVILCPPSPVPAFVHGCDYTPLTASYSILYNLLGMPAGVVPATRVRPGEESDRQKSRDAVDLEMARTESASTGLPIGVQVVARHWREDVALAVMEFLEAHFKTQADYPAEPPIN